MRSVIILFAKAPVPGRVKTRLALDLGDHAAASLHEAFVQETLARLPNLRADIELHTDTATDAWPTAGVARRLQASGDLGVRMLAALTAALAEGRPQAMIVGSDSPDLPVSHLEDLFNRSSDVALGPCEDGGYYAIACRRTHPEMFRGVSWSSATTLADTEGAARACGLTVERGMEWYDVDDLAGLRRYRGVLS